MASAQLLLAVDVSDAGEMGQVTGSEWLWWGSKQNHYSQTTGAGASLKLQSLWSTFGPDWWATNHKSKPWTESRVLRKRAKTPQSAVFPAHNLKDIKIPLPRRLGARYFIYLVISPHLTIHHCVHSWHFFPPILCLSCRSDKGHTIILVYNRNLINCIWICICKTINSIHRRRFQAETDFRFFPAIKRSDVSRFLRGEKRKTETNKWRRISMDETEDPYMQKM